MGNIESTNSEDLHIDDTAPVTTSDALETYVNQASIAILAEDIHSGVHTIEYSLDDGQWQTAAALETSVTGLHSLECRATDAVGNTSSSVTTTFAVLSRYEETSTRIA